VSPARALTAVAVVVALAGVAAAIVDYRVTLSRVPELPDCTPYTEQCEQGLDARNEERQTLEGDHRRRSWIYSVAVLGAALGATVAASLGRRTPREQQRVFANLGVAGVVLGLVVAGLFLLADTLTIEPGVRPAFLPSVGMLTVAAVGGLITRGQSGRRLEVGGRKRQIAWRLSLAGLGFTAVTFVLAWIYTEHVSSCGPEDDLATRYLLGTALATSVAAGLFGLLGLLAGRWFLALVYFVLNPVLLLAFVVSCLE
jgi:hypothetical protein